MFWCMINLSIVLFPKERSTRGANSWQHTGTEGRWSVTQEFLAYAAIIRRTLMQDIHDKWSGFTVNEDRLIMLIVVSQDLQGELSV